MDQRTLERELRRKADKKIRAALLLYAPRRISIPEDYKMFEPRGVRRELQSDSGPFQSRLFTTLHVDFGELSL